jgi:hypothetical protein
MRPSKEDTRNPLIGKWLCCAEGWLFPVAARAEVSVALSRVQQAERKTNLSPSTELRTEMGRLDEEVQREKTAIYNAQPRWSLRDIQIDSSREASQLVGEFLRLVQFAAAEFCWTFNRPVKKMDWKLHSWKHTTFAEIERIIADVNAGRWLPPEVTLDLIGSDKDVQQLFERAEVGEPDAVARVDSLFPFKEDKCTAARHVFGLSKEQLNPRIPSVGDVAARLAKIAVRSPDSHQADLARHQLERLVSKQAVKGSRPRGGRPRTPHHEETVTTVWMMSFAVSKQMREVQDFLQTSEPDKQKRDTKIEQSYPWVSGLLRSSCGEFLGYGNTQNALQLAGKFLGLSASKIQKVVYT